jgi:hypothetical protein
LQGFAELTDIEREAIIRQIKEAIDVYRPSVSELTGIILSFGPEFYKLFEGIGLGLADLQSRPIFTMADQNFILSSKTLMGYPYETSEVLPTTAVAVSSPIIFFGNLQNATLAERNSLEIAMSEHATVGSNNAFEKNMKFYRFEESYDIVIEQPTLFSKAVTKSS